MGLWTLLLTYGIPVFSFAVYVAFSRKFFRQNFSPFAIIIFNISYYFPQNVFSVMSVPEKHCIDHTEVMGT